MKWNAENEISNESRSGKLKFSLNSFNAHSRKCAAYSIYPFRVDYIMKYALNVWQMRMGLMRLVI